MSGEPDDFDRLLASVADGESVDWDALERRAPDAASLALVRELRLIAAVADVHRSALDEVAADPDAVMTMPVGGSGSEPLPGPESRRIWPDMTRAHVAASVDVGVWGHLRLVRKIGEGSFGEVYHAHDTWLDHPVALKLLKKEAEARVAPTQLLHEARKLARVRHTNVVAVHGADRHNGRVGFWMDLIDGETLATRVSRGRLSAGEAVSVGQEVCRALAAVHQAKLIHRDVKAQNVMRAHDGGRIILMDFGAGEFVGDRLGRHAHGTPLYLAPELLRGEDASVRSDIYAVGVLLYHLVTGRFPVEGGSVSELAEAHAHGDRRRLRDERPDLPESFIAIVERALDPAPARRYASAGEMEAKLSGEPSTRPVSLAPSKAAPKPSLFKRVAMALAAVVGLTGALGFIATRFFEVILQVDPDFWSGFVDTFRVGVSGLFPYVVLWLFGAAVLAGLAIVGMLLRRLMKASWGKVVGTLESRDPVALATTVFGVGAAALILLNFVVYRDLYSTLFALQEPPSAPTRDFTILGPLQNEVRRDHLLISVYLSMLLGLATWVWFPRLERRAANPSTIRLLKWGMMAVTFFTIAADVMPRRILWETYPVVEFENRTALVIGSTRDELFLYEPDAPGRPRRRVRADSPALRRLGENRSIFAREPQD